MLSRTSPNTVHSLTLVVLTVYVFLQNFRATIIPAIIIMIFIISTTIILFLTQF